MLNKRQEKKKRKGGDKEDVMPSWKKKVEQPQSPRNRPKPSIKDAVAQFFFLDTWYDRDVDGWWYVNDFMVPYDRKQEIESAWRAEGNVPPPVPEL